MLPTERNTNDRNAEQEAEKQMRERNPDAAKDDPQDVHQGVKATRAGRTVCYHRSEGDK